MALAASHPKGKLTIIEGDPGEGKSFLSPAIAAAVTRGFGLPGEEEQREPEAVLIMSAEDGLQIPSGRALRIWARTLGEWWRFVD